MSGAKKDMQNYRGVNTVPNLAKIFDIVIRDQLKLIITPHIRSTQHCFLPGRNIETNLFEQTTHIYEAFDRHAQLDMFLSDVSKAFDHVDSSKQIRKLAQHPLSNQSILWFKSYLTDRCQYLKIGNAKSRILRVSSGVGQGSVNGLC